MIDVQLINGDCLLEMEKISSESIDMVLTDLPYGTTKCKWDICIPFNKMWAQLNRIIKSNGAILLFGGEPFASALRMSNIQNYKYDWIWDKITARGHLVAKKRPMAQHENICVFGNGAIIYNPQMVKRDKPIRGTEGKRTEIMGGG